MEPTDVQLTGERHEFTATFVKVMNRMNAYLGRPEQRIMLENFKGPDVEHLTHARQSFYYGERFKKLGALDVGDRISFNAVVVLTEYGVIRLLRPTKIVGDFDTSSPTPEANS